MPILDHLWFIVVIFAAELTSAMSSTGQIMFELTNRIIRQEEKKEEN